MAQNRVVQRHRRPPGPRETPVNYNTDAAYGGSKGFAPGSTFKPFTLAQWLKEGHSLNEVIDAQAACRTRCQRVQRVVRPLRRRARTSSATPRASGGVMSVLDATKNSVNSGYIAMASQLDLCGDDRHRDARSASTRRPTGEAFNGRSPPTCIGSDAVAPLHDGRRVRRVRRRRHLLQADRDHSASRTPTGAELPVPSANCQQAIEPRIANARELRAQQRLAGHRRRASAHPPFPSAGKTGTTSHNEHTWFVGYTPRVATAVWVGHTRRHASRCRDVWINGRFVRNAYGSTIAAPTWKRFMVSALNDGRPTPASPHPADKEVARREDRRAVRRRPHEADARGRLSRRRVQGVGRARAGRSALPAGTVVSQSPSGSAARGSYVTLTLSNGSRRPPDPNQPGLPGGRATVTPVGGGGGNGRRRLSGGHDVASPAPRARSRSPVRARSRTPR